MVRMELEHVTTGQFTATKQFPQAATQFSRFVITFKELLNA